MNLKQIIQSLPFLRGFSPLNFAPLAHQDSVEAYSPQYSAKPVCD